MLVLSRKVGERIIVGDGIVITVVRMGQGSVRIGVEAPNEMAILRQELAPPAPGGTRSADTARPTGEATSVSPAEALHFII